MIPTPRTKAHILFLFSDTGGGHRSAAVAICEALELEFPDQVTTEMVDIFIDYAPPPINLAPVVYPTLARMPVMWEMGYRLSDGRRRARFGYKMLWPYIRRSLSRLLDEHPCDLIVSVHQLINNPVAKEAQKKGIPFITVVTDMVSTHAAWYSPRADLVIVPTDAAHQRAITMGLSAENVKVTGMPVTDRFCQPVENKTALRKMLGWQPDTLTAVLVGGGEGMGPLGKIAEAIDKAHLPLQLVIICGRNRTLMSQLKAAQWNNVTHIYGFSQEMATLMRAADFLISKAGPGTISEAFIAGLPIILYSKMPGQEDGNVDYVVGEGAGVWAPDPEKVVNTLRDWINNHLLRQQVIATALKLARPDASRQIAQLLMEKARRFDKVPE